MTVISAAGAVLWRQTNSIEIAVVHRPRYDDWTLPKGKLDKGESIYIAAVREVLEETGYQAVLSRYLRQVAYEVQGAAKTVDYFAAEAVAGSFVPNEEVDELRWLAPSAAAPLLTHDHDRAVLASFLEYPVTTTLLLVRHAHAGNKAEWDGPDDERPLSPQGLAQRAVLDELLPLFGPTQVHATPKVRCFETVAPLADRLGVAIVPEPVMSEASHQGYPACAVTRLLEIAALGAPAVVCSQGGVIPDVVEHLGKESGMELGLVSSRKGSVWVLSFLAGVLVSAHYIDRR
ncbi:Hydrolase MutT1 [Alloactinosynnema sp. L-07]|uniref:NUDIX hydrolase n=1 Tax=Alloactinosynnema sp. L-07 TaxID=1653480 RepID=UPI00065EFE57|nr:NUDIX domain-containing protein [Alloactinosynnema sp. L-07]CRK58731.1 Hydrolase MutT1 [Alloactinosynnema sp. L-07]